MKNKLITWIVLAYNVEAFVSQCLQSLVSVGLPENEYEILVINDGSTDNTMDVIKDFACNHPSIKVLTQENQGISATRNRGIDLAEGEYIHFVDSDDYVINGNLLAKCIKYALENNIDLLTFKYQRVSYNSIFKENEQNLIGDLSFSEIVDGQSFLTKYPSNYTVWTYIIKRQFCIKNHLRFVPGMLLEDFQFNINTFCDAKRCVNADATLYSYRNNSNSIMHIISKNKQLKLINSYIANAHFSKKFIESKHNILKEGFKQLIKERGNEMLIYGFMRAFKIDEVRYYIGELRKNNMYPFEWLTRPEYQIKKIKMFYRISQHENLTVFLSKLFKIYCRINSKALQFNNW